VVVGAMVISITNPATKINSRLGSWACSSLPIAMPASVVVGMGRVSMICRAFRWWVWRLRGLPQGGLVLVYIRHHQQVAVEDFGEPVDKSA
jgi:hypothetical protein